jgi:uncharacterized protein (DUF1810 family)
MSLERFLQAQEQGGSYERALAELKAGEKSSHWMWWIFPQEPREGTSETSRLYALMEDEARDYLRHPLLGMRYRECVGVVHGQLCRNGVAPLTLMGGEVDAKKLGSSLELFLKIAPAGESVFRSQAEAILEVLGEGRDGVTTEDL